MKTKEFDKIMQGIVNLYKNIDIENIREFDAYTKAIYDVLELLDNYYHRKNGTYYRPRHSIFLRYGITKDPLNGDIYFNPTSKE